ncbi:MAG: hypothetical protein ACOYMA_00390 [Bacteroidia bacterium]
MQILKKTKLEELKDLDIKDSYEASPLLIHFDRYFIKFIEISKNLRSKTNIKTITLIDQNKADKLFADNFQINLLIILEEERKRMKNEGYYSRPLFDQRKSLVRRLVDLNVYVDTKTKSATKKAINACLKLQEIANQLQIDVDEAIEEHHASFTNPYRQANKR